MATALRNLRAPAKQLQALCLRERWAVATGGVTALAVLGIVCWWWRGRSGNKRGQDNRHPAAKDAGEDPAASAAVEPLLQENDDSVGRSCGVAEPVGESSDSEIEEVLSRGALARLAAARAAQAARQAEADAATAFFSASTEVQAGSSHGNGD